MSGTVVLENQTQRHLQYRIGHKEVCVKVGRCFCKKGRRGNVAMTVHVAGGRGVRTAPLDPAVALAPQIKADAECAKPKIRIIRRGTAKTRTAAQAKGVVAREAPAETTQGEETQAQADSSKLSENKGSGGRKGKHN